MNALLRQPNLRDCDHGKLARSCDICEYEAEIALLRDLLAEAVRQDYGTPGWRARAIKAGCIR
jgi:hypothetical protein